MDITLEKKNDNYGIIRVLIEEKDYKPAYTQKLKEYSKTVSMKGFRPGKVPIGLIKKMAGSSLKADVITEKLTEELNAFLQNSEEKFLGEPLPHPEEDNKLNLSDKSHSFVYEIGITPNYALKFEDIPAVKQYEVIPLDKDIDGQVEELRKNFGPTTEVDSVEEDEDFIGGSFKSKPAEGEEIEFENVYFQLKRAAEDKQGLLKGKKLEDSFNVNFAELFPDANERKMAIGAETLEAAEDVSEGTLTLNKVNRRELAELNEDLYRKAFGPDADISEIDGEDGLRDYLRSEWRKGLSDSAKGFNSMLVQDALVDNSVGLELPEEYLVRFLNARNTEQNAEEDLPNLRSSFKWEVIREQLVDDFEIKVENHEVMEIAASEFRANLMQMGIGAHFLDSMEPEQRESMLNNFLFNKENGQYDSIYFKTLTSKVIDAVKEKVTIQTEELDREKFQELSNDYFAERYPALQKNEEEGGEEDEINTEEEKESSEA